MQKLRLGTASTALMVCALMGCKMPQQRADDAAISQAKLLAAQSGMAQQVVWSDTAGNLFTVVVQPPLPGHKDQAVTRTIGKVPGDPRVLAPVTNTPSGPVVTPYSSALKK